MLKYLFLFFFLNHGAFATVNINSYHKFEWRTEWTEALTNTLLQDDHKIMLNRFIDEDDLNELNCPDYNYASLEEKLDFWQVFFAALVRSESGLNEKARSPKMRGHRSYGLLQLAPQTAKRFCDLNSIEDDILNGTKNLACGIKLLSWQLSGAPDKNGKMKRADLENQLFGKKILLWGPLRQNDKQGRKRLYQFFHAHLDQLPFCSV